jgi:hypothetical protein
VVRGGVVKKSAREDVGERRDGGPMASLESIMTELALFLLLPVLAAFYYYFCLVYMSATALRLDLL